MAWAPNYCTSDELKAFMRIADVADDVQVGLAIAAASRAVDRTTRRQFGTATGARIYTPRLDGELCRTVVDTDDLVTVSAVAADTAGDGGFVDNITVFTLRPPNSALDGFPFTQVASGKTSTVPMPLVPDSVRVTGTFGWAAVPDAVKEATLLQASRLLARREAPFGVAGSPEVGSEVRLLAKVDPDVEVALGRYVRRGWGFA
jgi:hypothetical protein